MEPAAPVVPACHRGRAGAAIHHASTPRRRRAVDVALDRSRGCRGRRVGDATARHPSRSSPATGDDDDDTYRLTGTADGAAHRGGERDRRGARHLRPRRAGARRPVGRRAPRRGGHLAPAVPHGRHGRRRRRRPTRPSGRPATTTRTRRRPSPTCSCPTPPYIDQESLAEAYDDFDVFLRHSLANGYNAVAFPGLRRVRDVRRRRRTAPSTPRATSTARRRSRCARRSARSGTRADELGMKVFLRTDMLTLTTPLEDYLTDRFGSLDTENPELWDVYAAGLDELYAAEPALDGVLIRIGEAGRVYDVEGWDYYSAARRDDSGGLGADDARDAQRAGRGIRSRSDLPHVERGRRRRRRHAHEPDASYEAVLGGIDSPALIVSTKYTLGDFYSWLPLNVTLEQGAAAPDRRVPEPPRVRELRRLPQRPRAASTSSRCRSSSPRTRTSRASGPGRRTAGRGAPGR